MVQADAVERVQEGEAALDLVRLDHRLKDVVYSQGLALAGEMVGDCKDGPKVVGRMSPLRGEEAVVVIQPPDLGANVECTTDRVKLIVCTRDLGACESWRPGLRYDGWENDRSTHRWGPRYRLPQDLAGWHMRGT